MPKTNVTHVRFPLNDNMTPTQVLGHFEQRVVAEEIEDVLVVAYDKNGGLILLSSHMSRAEAAFMLHKAQLWAYGEFTGD